MASTPPPPTPVGPPPQPGPAASRDEWRAWQHQMRDYARAQGHAGGWYGPGYWPGPWGWWGGGSFWAVALVVIGVYYLLQNLGLLSWRPKPRNRANSAHAQEVLPSLLGLERRQPPRDAGGRARRHSLRAARPRPLLVATDAGRGGRFPERARRLERHLARFAAEAAVRRAQWRGRGRDVRRHSREKWARRRGARPQAA